MIDFVGAQAVRTPAFYQKIRPIIRNALSAALDEVAHELHDAEKINRLINTNGNMQSSPELELIPLNLVDEGESDLPGYEDIRIESVEGKSTWLWAVQHLLKEPLKYLHRHKWSIISTEIPIPTSDDPVICLNYYNKDDYNFNGGWMQKGTEIICPISPYKLLYTQIGVRHEPRMFYPKEKCSILKKMITQHAFREIYGLVPDQEVCEIRPRIVDEKRFIIDKKESEEWYKKYTEKESVLLKSKRSIVKKNATTI